MGAMPLAGHTTKSVAGRACSYTTRARCFWPRGCCRSAPWARCLWPLAPQEHRGQGPLLHNRLCRSAPWARCLWPLAPQEHRGQGPLPQMRYGIF